MIEKRDCYIFNRCKKALDGTCQHDDCSFCQKLFRVNYLFDESLMTDKQRKRIDLKLDDDGTDKEEFDRLKTIEDNIEDFVSSGENLYIHSSNCGNTKTSWALRLMQSYVEKIWYKSDLSCRVLFISVPRFLLAIKDNISTPSEYVKHIKDNVLDCDLVVWDEIGTKAPTQFEHEHLLSLINLRIDNGKSNIYTSNLNPAQLKAVVGDRLYSRISNLSIDIEFFGKDKRGIYKE